MEELVILLIRLIGRMMSGPPTVAQKRAVKPTPQLAAPQPQGRRVAAAPVRKAAAGRARTARVAVAQPIVTGPAANAPAAGTLAPAIQPMKRILASNAGKPSGLTPESLRKWLNPETLRKEYLLTEILQKPLALREPVDR